MADAEDALRQGDLTSAERIFLDAAERRDASPGRVFFTEKITDGLSRLVRRGGERPGRWARRASRFRTGFAAEAETVVRSGVRVAELRPEDDAERNQPILETALFLVARSRLFPEEPASAVPLIKGLFRTASRTGRPFDVHLVRHDIPLTEEDRLWMARKGGQLLEAFVEQGLLEQGSAESEEWVEVFLQLLRPEYFGATSRLGEERSWLKAVTADRLLGRAQASVEHYRAYLDANPGQGPRADEARVRLLELLGNTDRVHFSVPRYDEALRALQSAGLAPGSDLLPRYQRALERIEYRRPDPDPTLAVAPLWSSAAVEGDGRVAVVFWCGDEPRDVAFWRPGESCESLDRFLAPCGSRIVAADRAVLTAASGLWDNEPADWPVEEVLVAVMEHRLPAGGPDRSALLRLGLGETAPWRTGWDPVRGHPLLEPPRSSSLLEAWPQGAATSALLAGLLWLAVRSRLKSADPSLRAGIGEMARRGDGPSRLLYDFLCMGDEAGRAVDASFAPWTLPLLWTRPDPFGWTLSGAPADGNAEPVAPAEVRPDLGRNDLAIVSTGDPASVLAAWGEGRQKWRVVLDRFDRLAALSRVVGGVVGPVTVIPPDGAVHALGAALDLLEGLLRQRRSREEALLPLFHWIRLVESHNGDLLDFQRVRPRPAGVTPLYDLYATTVRDLPCEAPRLEPDDAGSTWADQFSQRVRKAGLVAGSAARLTTDGPALDACWGVFEGSDASWVFLDSAAVHWSLLQREDLSIGSLHARLHSRGARHLSLLTGAVWLRGELENLLGTWLQSYGSPYCLSLTDGRPPLLRLADRGVAPDARWLKLPALAGPAAWTELVCAEDGEVTVQLPGDGLAAEFWDDIRRGALAVGGPRWRYRAATPLAGGAGEAAGGRLVVPVLASLDQAAMPLAAGDSRADWAGADAERSSFLAWRTKLCALEIARHLAGPWTGVDVLDVRWWRLLRARGGAPGVTDGAPRRWSGEQAAALAAPAGCRLIDLPGTSGAGTSGATAVRSLGRTGELTSQWLTGRGDAATAAAPPVPAAGVTIVEGDGGPAWRGLAADIAQAWEQGELERWLLLVADECPADAADLVAAGAVAAMSVWQAEGGGGWPAPVVWAKPADFTNAKLAGFLGAAKPAAVLADDVARWLPGAGREAPETAAALREILACGAERVVLRASSLTSPWRRYLAEACGAPAPLAGPDGAGAEASAAAEVQDIEVHDTEARDAESAAAPADDGAVDRPGALIRRFRSLIGRVRSLVDGVESGAAGDDGPRRVSSHQLLPVSWLSALSGLDTADITLGVSLLRWSARLAGDSLSSAGSSQDGGARRGHSHALLIPTRFAELEARCGELAEDLRVLVPLWCGRLRPGDLVWVDLDQPPAELAPAALARLDTYLLQFARAAGHGGPLVYRCPRGALRSTQRLVGSRVPLAELAAALIQDVELFSARIRKVMAAAVETGDGFLVETGLDELRPDEEEFLSRGAALGFWRWLGPAGPGSVALVDLLTLADSPTVKEGRAGWRLLGDHVAGRFGREATEDRRGEAAAARSRFALRHLLPGAAGGGDDDLDATVERVGALVGGEGDDRFLVLRGMLGSGRHEVVARALLWAERHAADPGEIVVHCPDQATAARIAREALAAGCRRTLDIRLPEAAAGAGRTGRAPFADTRGSVVIMCEVQRYEAETRYRLAQMGRDRRLLMTVDPAATSEPWEHLFLTTPRAGDVVDLVGQRRQARRLWSEVGRLAAGQAGADGPARRREKGQLTVEPAANLDQCVARILAAVDAGEVGSRLRLTAPLATDLDYLGSTLGERGWVAVDEARLDFLLLPGPREFLAAATDELAAAGRLGLRFAPDAAAAEGGSDRDSPAAGGAAAGFAPLLPALLGDGRADAAARWRDGRTPDADLTVGAFAAALEAAAWAQGFLAYPACRERVAEVVRAWGREPLTALPDIPLWEAWWAAMLRDTGGRLPALRPHVLLGEAARPGGGFMPGGVYLCGGAESPRRHYEVLGRLTDDALVLFQEVSPFERPAH